MRLFKHFLIAGSVALAGLSSVQADMSRVEYNFDAVNISAAVEKTQVFIVQMRDDPAVAYSGGIGKYQATKPGNGQKINPNSAHVRKYVDYLESTHDEALQAVGVDEKIYSYRFALNGFAAVMTTEQAEALRARSDVVQVWQDEIRQMTTDSTPDYLGLTGEGGVWDLEGKGEDIIVGILDSGIWPEHPSFSDQEDFSHATGARQARDKGRRKLAYGPPPSSWNGSCQSGKRWSQTNCNNKIIGARYYPDGFSANGMSGLLTDDFLSARDSDGHGSHVASTAAGNEGPINTITFKPVSGVAPRARIAVYKVCWDPRFGDPGCASSDSAAAIDQAVADGVDVINFSIGGSSTSFSSPDDIAFLFAADAGVFVATSNGNAGPGSQTTGTPAGVPWITAVGAAQDNEVFAINLDVSGDLNDSYFAREGAGDVPFTSDITGDMVPADPLDGCSSLNNDIGGEIALVIRGTCSFTTKYNNAAAAGASAIIVYNDGTAGDRIDPIVMSAPGTTIPGAMIGFFDGDLIESTVSGGGSVTGTIGPSTEVSQDNRIAGFSSRGPNGGAPDIIKPDIAAPGVSIIAAETLEPNSNNSGGVPYQSISGTSMSSPHAAGAFALLKEAHPNWSAAAAKSALMTSARQDLKKTVGDDAADPFDIGAGAIVPAGAFEPGLIYPAGLFDYAAFSCENNFQIFNDASCDFVTGLGYPTDASDLNLASIGIAELVGSQTVTRIVTSVTAGTTTFDVAVDAPPGIDVVVSPNQLVLEEGESAAYTAEFTPNGAAVMGAWTFGSLTWTNDAGVSDARSPIAIRPLTTTNANVFTKTVDASEVVSGDTLTYELSVTNDVMTGPITVTDVLPAGTTFVPASETEVVTGGSTTSSWVYDGGSNSLSWTGELELGELSVTASPSPFGYFSLADFGEDPFDLPSNCDDGAFSINLSLPFTYGGTSYSSVIWSVNGTIEAGTASGLATSFNNLELPDATLPNNLLAPFWRDLNLCDSGNWYIAGLFDGSNVWWVFEWEDAPHFGSTDAVTLQVWIAADGFPAAGEIYYVFERLDNTSDGVTVGAENASGTIGDNYFYQSSLSNPDPAIGTPPEVGVDLIVETLPGGNATLGFQVTTDCSEDTTIVNEADLSSSDNSENAIAITGCSAP